MRDADKDLAYCNSVISEINSCFRGLLSETITLDMARISLAWINRAVAAETALRTIADREAYSELRLPCENCTEDCLDDAVSCDDELWTCPDCAELIKIATDALGEGSE